MLILIISFSNNDSPKFTIAHQRLESSLAHYPEIVLANWWYHSTDPLHWYVRPELDRHNSVDNSYKLAVL